MAEMWLRRVIAVSALALAVLAIVVVALHPVSSAPADSQTPTPMPTVKAKARKQSASLPVVGEITGTRARRMAVPILMYHVIAAAPPRVANAELWVDEEVFADEMRALHAAGYTAVTLRRHGTAGGTAGRCRASRS